MPSFAFLSPQEVETLHQATLRILGEVGVVLNHPGGRKILTEAGARIQNERVLLPPELVEKCIGLCPKTVTVRGRGGTVKTLGDGNLYFHNLGGTPPACWTRSKIAIPSPRFSRRAMYPAN